MKPVNFDMGEIDQYAKQLEKQANHVNGNSAMSKAMETFLLEMAFRFEAKVKNLTPAVSGRLRASWKVGSVMKQGNLYFIEVYNPTEYASYVEYGHRQEPGRYVKAIGKRLKKSWVEGKFMATISAKQLEREIPNHLQGFLSRLISGIK